VEQPGPARWFGVYPARVSDVKDPDNQGRVQVELMVAPDEGGETFRVWARIATLMAGRDRGSFFIPEVDDEVLVAFHAGDPRRPYMVGALWNGQDAPPVSMDAGGQNNLRTIKTRSGHVLEFDDTAGAAKITLQTPNGCKVILDDGAGGKVTIENPAGAKIELEAAGTMKVTAPAGLTVEAAMVTVNSAMSTFNGVVKADTVISTTVIGSTYTPGAGNLW
jgi:uncharacterized protein involved in type VI secretion and phage assembly